MYPFDCLVLIYYAVLTRTCGMSALLLASGNVYADEGIRVYDVRRKFASSLPAGKFQLGSAPV